MITYQFPHNLNQEDQDFIVSLQKQQSPMIRTAYVQAFNGIVPNSIRAELNSRFEDNELDSWFKESAYISGSGMAKSDHKLERNTRIFGGKQNLIRRSKGLISNEEFKEHRLLPLYSVGACNSFGNRKFEFNQDHVIFKPYKGKKIRINLPNIKKEWRKVWNQLVILASQKLIPITVSLTKDYIAFSFDDNKVKESLKSTIKPIKNRYVGIDLNPNYIGVSIFDDCKLIDTKLFSLKDLTSKHIKESKLEHETINVAHAIGKWIKHNRVDKVFVEELNFKQGSRNKGKNLNRLCINQWKRSAFTKALSKYYDLIEINAAYTSTIGNVLHPELPDPIASSTEIAQRGYRLVILKNKQFYPPLPSVRYIEELWKQTTIPLVKDWKELHSWVKNTGVKYRVPLPSEESFRIFSSPSSFVGVL